MCSTKPFQLVSLKDSAADCATRPPLTLHLVTCVSGPIADFAFPQILSKPAAVGTFGVHATLIFLSLVTPSFDVSLIPYRRNVGLTERLSQMILEQSDCSLR